MSSKIMAVLFFIPIVLCSKLIINEAYSVQYSSINEIHLEDEIDNIIAAGTGSYLKKNTAANTIELYNLSGKKLWYSDLYTINTATEGICFNDGSAVVKCDTSALYFDNKGNHLWSYNFGSDEDIFFIPLGNKEILLIHNKKNSDSLHNFSGISLYKLNRSGETIVEKQLEHSENIIIEKAEYHEDYGLFISGIDYGNSDYFDGKFIASLNTDILDFNWKKSASDLQSKTFSPDFVFADQYLFLIKNVYVEQDSHIPDLMMTTACLSKLDLEGNEISEIDLRTLAPLGNIPYLSADNLTLFNDKLLFTTNSKLYDVSKDTPYLISIDFNGNLLNQKSGLSRHINKIIPTTGNSFYILEKQISKILQPASIYTSYTPLDTYMLVTEYDVDFNRVEQLEYNDFHDTDKEDILFFLPDGTIISY